ncbi:hypothetical protein [Catalinimonas alkaloidigena]|uniref:hypothetical protein n=1 Tax=Catalinimonas alkaloidigena TaxID=1075417 RepID=UPI00240524EB|nr:hypothetical protein [Catalinimonas alkaloidigena]
MSKLKLFFLICYFLTANETRLQAGDTPQKVLLTDFKFRTLNQFLFPNYFQDSITEEVIFEKAVALITMRIGDCEIATYQPEKIRYDINSGDVKINKVPRNGFDYYVQIASHIDGIQDIFLGFGLIRFQFVTQVRMETPDGKEVFTHQYMIPFNSSQEHDRLFDERIIGKEDFTDLYIQSLEGVFHGKDHAKGTLKFIKPAVIQYEDFLSEANPYSIKLKVGVFGKKLNFNDVKEGKSFVVEVKEGIPVGSGVDAEGIYEKSRVRKNYTVKQPLAQGTYKIKTFYKSARKIANFITVGEPAFTLQGMQDEREIFYFQAGLYEDRFDGTYSPQLLKIEGFRAGSTYLIKYNTFSNFSEIRVNDTLIGMVLLGQNNFDELALKGGDQYQLYIREGPLPEGPIIDAFLIYMICSDFLLGGEENASDQD